MRFLFNTVIWGEDYVDKFLRLSLPTLMAEGNIDGFPWLSTSLYQVMTTSADRRRFEENLLFQRLQRWMEVEFVDIDHIQVNTRIPTHKYSRVSLAQMESLRTQANKVDGFFFLYPDFVYSTGALTRVAARLTEGYRAVLCPIPCLCEEAVAQGLYETEGLVLETVDGPIVPIAPRRLVDLSLRFPHPVMHGFKVGLAQRAEWPAQFIWEVPGQGWLIHSFHLHPIAIRSEPANPNFYTRFEVSLDDEFVSKLYSFADLLYFASDSDEIAMCSLRPNDAPPQPIPGRRDDTLAVVRWAEEYSSLLLRHFTRFPFRWHNASMREADWAAAESLAVAFLDRVREHLRIPDSILEYDDPITYAARKRRNLHFTHHNA